MNNNKTKHFSFILLFSTIAVAVAFLMQIFTFKPDGYIAKAQNTTVAQIPILSLEGNGTSSEPYLIYSEKDLKNFSNYVNLGGSTSGKYYKMATSGMEIVISSLPQIGTATHPFNGTFDGNNAIIYGTLPYTNTYSGVFGKVYYATIKNLTVLCDKFEAGAKYAGAVVGYAQYSTISNCKNVTAININTSSNAIYVGGICGYAYSTLISQCTNSANINGQVNSEYVCNVGGICGYCYFQPITDCKVIYYTPSAEIYISASSSSTAYCGGVVGYISSTSVSTSFCQGANIIGYGKNYSYVGGIAGYSNNSITNCFNRSSVSASADEKVTEGTETNPCSSTYLGGKDGQSVDMTMNGTTAKTITTSKWAYAGGIVGYCSSEVKNCYNTGSVSGGYYRIQAVTTITFGSLAVSSDGPSRSGYNLTKTLKVNIKCTYTDNVLVSQINGYSGKTGSNVYGFYGNLQKDVSFDISEDYSYSCTVWGGVKNPPMPAGSGSSHNNLLNESYCNYASKTVQFTKLDSQAGTNLETANINITLSGTYIKINVYITTNHDDVSASFDLYSANINNRKQNYSVISSSGIKTSLFKGTDKNLPSGFSSDIWGYSNIINNGYPHLKKFYWQDAV